MPFARYATEHANAKMACPRTNPSGNLVVTVLLHENLVWRGGTWPRKMFSSVLSKAVGLGMFSIAGGAPTSTKRPRKSLDNATHFAFSGSTKIPLKTVLP